MPAADIVGEDAILNHGDIILKWTYRFLSHIYFPSGAFFTKTNQI